MKPICNFCKSEKARFINARVANYGYSHKTLVRRYECGDCGKQYQIGTRLTPDQYNSLKPNEDGQIKGLDAQGNISQQ